MQDHVGFDRAGVNAVWRFQWFEQIAHLGAVRPY